MARDTFGLMDALGMPSAHVVGLLLGGMTDSMVQRWIAESLLHAPPIAKLAL